MEMEDRIESNGGKSLGAAKAVEQIMICNYSGSNSFSNDTLS